MIRNLYLDEITKFYPLVIDKNRLRNIWINVFANSCDRTELPQHSESFVQPILTWDVICYRNNNAVRSCHTGIEGQIVQNT